MSSFFYKFFVLKSRPIMTTPKSVNRLLSILKIRGPQTTASLSEALDISVPAVRQHLKNLVDSGRVTKTESSTRGKLRNGVGRPAQSWSLTSIGHREFPDAHAEMTVALIASVRATLGEDALDRIIDDRYARTLARYQARITPEASLPAKLDALLDLRDEEGYMPEVVEDENGGWLLIENHCPICSAAEACQGFCRTELDLFRTVLDAPVERIEYLITGDRRCVYRIATL